MSDTSVCVVVNSQSPAQVNGNDAWGTLGIANNIIMYVDISRQRMVMVSAATSQTTTNTLDVERLSRSSGDANAAKPP